MNVAQIIDIVEKLVTILGFIVAGLWTYYKFFRGRTFKPQLEPKIAVEVVTLDGRGFLKITTSLKNVGLSEVPIMQQGSGVKVFTLQPNNDQSFADSVEWDFSAILDVFEHHKWIEPNEEIEDHFLVRLVGSEQQAFKVEVRIQGKKTAWHASSIVVQS